VNGPAPAVISPSPPATKKDAGTKISFGGMIANLDEIKAEIIQNQEKA
jgi:hypothetical protein